MQCKQLATDSYACSLVLVFIIITISSVISGTVKHQRAIDRVLVYTFDFYLRVNRRAKNVCDMFDVSQPERVINCSFFIQSAARVDSDDVTKYHNITIALLPVHHYSAYVW